jgi:hypothetical protein
MSCRLKFMLPLEGECSGGDGRGTMLAPAACACAAGDLFDPGSPSLPPRLSPERAGPDAADTGAEGPLSKLRRLMLSCPPALNCPPALLLMLIGVSPLERCALLGPSPWL